LYVGLHAAQFADRGDIVQDGGRNDRNADAVERYWVSAWPNDRIGRSANFILFAV
jgi:hypothetical protein